MLDEEREGGERKVEEKKKGDAPVRVPRHVLVHALDPNLESGTSVPEHLTGESTFKTPAAVCQQHNQPKEERGKGGRAREGGDRRGKTGLVGKKTHLKCGLKQ